MQNAYYAYANLLNLTSVFKEVSLKFIFFLFDEIKILIIGYLEVMYKW